MANFVLSPLLYFISLISISIFIALTFAMGFDVSRIVYVDLTLFGLGHIGFALLALSCWRKLTGKFGFHLAAMLPVYWLLSSFAAWRAVWKLIVAPHQWEKTQHDTAYNQPRPPVARG